MQEDAKPKEYSFKLKPMLPTCFSPEERRKIREKERQILQSTRSDSRYTDNVQQ